MADEGCPRSVRYSAFLSYSHADAAFARQLQRRLEIYRLPRGLGQPDMVRREDPRRLKPVFRDRDELMAAPDLTEALGAALQASSALIVVCTPTAAKSEWVGREIALFRSIGGGGRIFTALAAGSPDGAFHSTLLSGTGPGNSPLAADFRPRGDGHRLALLKLVAVLAGVGLDELIRRDAHRRSRQRAMIAIAVVVVALVIGTSVWAMLQARANADHERERSLSSVDYALTELRDRAKKAGSLNMRDAANDVASRYLATTATLSDDELQASAKLLSARGEDSEARGDYAAAQHQFEQALAITGRLVAARPDDTKRIFAHAQSLYWVGFISWRVGDSVRAEAAFKDYATAAARLLQIEPGKPEWLLERAYAADNLGVLALRRAKDTTQAEAYFKDELATDRMIQRLRPTDSSISKGIADIYGWLGDIARLRGDYAGAAAARRTQRAQLEALLVHDRRNAELRSALVANRLAVARISADSGALAEAVTQFDTGRAAALKLAEADPDNESLARKVRIIQLFKARAWLAMPPGERPPANVIAATIGACPAERTGTKNAELSDFCTVLTARLREQSGDFSSADLLLRSLSRTTSPGHDALSEGWGIDFAHEIALSRIN